MKGFCINSQEMFSKRHEKNQERELSGLWWSQEASHIHTWILSGYKTFEVMSCVNGALNHFYAPVKNKCVLNWRDSYMQHCSGHVYVSCTKLL